MKNSRLKAFFVVALVQFPLAWAMSASAGSVDATTKLALAGKAIYERGLLPTGAPVVAKLEMGVTLKAAKAACMQCHRGSGSGSYEGGNLVPPVTAASLFEGPQSFGMQRRLAPGFEFKDFHFRTRGAYDSRSLAIALRKGVTPAGHQLNALMPRYEFSARNMAALEAYLRQLSASASPGVGSDVMHFATVFTPRADPEDRKAVIDVLSACFEEKYPENDRGAMSWRLHVWDLEGDVRQWPEQLNRYASAQPVFALVSGAATADWAPVHGYCESSGTPCLFPNVGIPATRKASKYNFYFSGGTLLEAEVMTRWIYRENAPKPKRFVQILGADHTVARAGADALRARLAGQPVRTEDRVLKDFSNEALVQVLHDIGPTDVLVLWLTQHQLSSLMHAVESPPAASAIMVSGWLGDIDRLEAAKPWREQLQIVYPFDPPARRELRMYVNLHPWLAKNGISKEREMVAGNTLATCNLVAEALGGIRGVYTREKLLEAVENYPSEMGNAMAPEAFYAFTLGPGQRFSAKGAFIVRYAQREGQKLEPLSQWIAP